MKIVLSYSPDAHRAVDLRTESLPELGRKLVEQATFDGWEIATDSPYVAQAVEIMARYLGREIEFRDRDGKLTDQSGFYRIFAGPMRELDIMRNEVDAFVAAGRPEGEDPFPDGDD